MAVTKIWAVKNTIDKAISYIEDEEKTKNKESNEELSLTKLVYYATNPQKTEKQYWVSGINCNAEKAIQEMQDIKVVFGKTKGVKAFHAVQSFAEGEVTPKIAHEIGVKLAQEMWGDRFQVVVSTHLNTENLHNHFVINSVSFRDGKKLYQDLAELALLRKKSDDLCFEYNLSSLKERPVPSGIDFEKFLIKYNNQNKYYEEVKQDIDSCIKQATSYIDFLKIMNEVGYDVIKRADKLSVRRHDRKRNIRIERVFGTNYSITKIEERIAVEQAPREPIKKYYGRNYVPIRRYKRKPRKSYLQKKYISKSLEYTMKIRKRRVPRQEDVKRLRIITENTMFLCSHNIETVEELLRYKENCNSKILEVSSEIRKTQRLLRKPNVSKEDKSFLIEKLKELKIEKSYQIDEIKKCNQVYVMTSAFREEQEKELERKEQEMNEHGDRYRNERG